MAVFGILAAKQNIFERGMQLLRAALAVLGFVLVSVRARAACPTYPLDQYYADIPVIFVGRALTQISTLGDLRTVWTMTTFEVDEVWKGKLTERTIRIATNGGPIAGTDYSSRVAKACCLRLGLAISCLPRVSYGKPVRVCQQPESTKPAARCNGSPISLTLRFTKIRLGSSGPSVPLTRRQR
jgi:hypothetical protein